MFHFSDIRQGNPRFSPRENKFQLIFTLDRNLASLKFGEHAGRKACLPRSLRSFSSTHSEPRARGGWRDRVARPTRAAEASQPTDRTARGLDHIAEEAASRKLSQNTCFSCQVRADCRWPARGAGSRPYPTWARSRGRLPGHPTALLQSAHELRLLKLY